MKQFREKICLMFLFLLGLFCSSSLEASRLFNLFQSAARGTVQLAGEVVESGRKKAALEKKKTDDVLKRIQLAKTAVASCEGEDIYYSKWVSHSYLNENKKDDIVYIPPSKFNEDLHEYSNPDYTGDIFGLSEVDKELIKIDKYVKRIDASINQLNIIKSDIEDSIRKDIESQPNSSNMKEGEKLEVINTHLEKNVDYKKGETACAELLELKNKLLDHEASLKNKSQCKARQLKEDLLRIDRFGKGNSVQIEVVKKSNYLLNPNEEISISATKKNFTTAKKSELLPKLEQAEKAFILKQQEEEGKPSQMKEAFKKTTEVVTHLFEEQMKAKVTADAEQKRIRQIFEFLQDPKKIAPVMAGFAAVAIAGASSFQFCGVFAQMLLKHYQTPQLIEWTTKLTPLQQLENRLYLLLGSRLASRFKLTFHQAPIRPFSDFKGTKAQMEFMNRYLASLKKMLVENAAGKAPLRLQSLGLFGQPGTGKTLLAQCLAHELGQYGFECYAIDGSSLQKFSETEALVQLDALFKYLEEQQNPSILFVDEAHSLLKDRRAAMGAATNVAAKAELIVNKWLAHIPEGLHHKILIIYSANYKEYLDPAILNRLTPVYFGAPDFEQRDKILALYEAKDIGAWGISFSDDYTSRRAEIIQKLEGLTGRQIRVCVKNMVDRALVKEELMLNFEDAIFAINDMLGGVGDESSAVVKMSSVFAQKN